MRQPQASNLVSLALALGVGGIAHAEEAPQPVSMDKLLQRVKSGWTDVKSQNKEREAKFVAERNKRKAMLEALKRKLLKLKHAAPRLAGFQANNPDPLNSKKLLSSHG